MAKTKTENAKKPAKSKKTKSGGKSKLTKYLAISALLIVGSLIGYHYWQKTKTIPEILHKPLAKIQQVWSTSVAKPESSGKKIEQPSIQQNKAVKLEKKQKRVISAERLHDFTSSISEAAKTTINLPFKHGGDPAKERATDNSHLIFFIWQEAAAQAGLSIGDYRPMHQLIADCREITLSQLTNGDLIVLNDGNAGMIYGFSEENDGFYLVYASASQNRVVKVNSKELKKYWLNPQNKKGYYRATDKIFH